MNKLLFLVAFAWGFVGLYAGYLIGSTQKKQMEKCFESCASLLLLTPDDPESYRESLAEVEKCANEL